MERISENHNWYFRQLSKGWNVVIRKVVLSTLLLKYVIRHLCINTSIWKPTLNSKISIFVDIVLYFARWCRKNVQWLKISNFRWGLIHRTNSQQPNRRTLTIRCTQNRLFWIDLNLNLLISTDWILAKVAYGLSKF